jgi:formylglycine-generating enzyme required for sulfatase activity
VTVPPFYIGKFAVTQAEWRVVAGWEKVERELKPDPSRFKGDDRPVENVNWEDAKEFCARLAKKTGRLYRLPSEAEWEYACRAGTTTPFAFGETITHEIVNYYSEYPYAKAKKAKPRSETVPVGSLGMANAFGLFDMHGNVWEWCEDVWHDSYNGAPKDGSAWLSGGDSTYRMLRGGSFIYVARLCRSAFRFYDDARILYDLVGFRVVVSARTS